MSVGGGSRTKRPPLHLLFLCGQRETHARADFKGTPVCSLAPPSRARPFSTGITREGAGLPLHADRIIVGARSAPLRLGSPDSSTDSDQWCTVVLRFGFKVA